MMLAFLENLFDTLFFLNAKVYELPYGISQFLTISFYVGVLNLKHFKQLKLWRLSTLVLDCHLFLINVLFINCTLYYVVDGVIKFIILLFFCQANLKLYKDILFLYNYFKKKNNLFDDPFDDYTK